MTATAAFLDGLRQCLGFIVVIGFCWIAAWLATHEFGGPW